MLKRTAKDTEVTTRARNNPAPDNPWRVMTRLNPAILKTASDSPGVKMLNIAGIATKSENSGTNTHVRFKKNPKLIREALAKIRQSAYRHNKTGMFLVKSIWRINKRKVTPFILGSKDCKNPGREAYSSAKIDSFKKDNAPSIERSIKLLFLNIPLYCHNKPMPAFIGANPFDKAFGFEFVYIIIHSFFSQVSFLL